MFPAKEPSASQVSHKSIHIMGQVENVVKKKGSRDGLMKLFGERVKFFHQILQVIHLKLLISIRLYFEPSLMSNTKNFRMVLIRNLGTSRDRSSSRNSRRRNWIQR